MAAQTATRRTSSTDSTNTGLRWVLQADALFEGLLGVVLLFGAGPLASQIGNVPPVILMGLGVTLLLVAGWLQYVATRQPISRQTTLLVASLNVGWTIISAIVLLAGWLPLTTFGKWAVALVADGTLILGLLQFYQLRRQ